jgi:hypothetical protein
VDWISLALGLVKLANGIIGWVQQTKQFNAGHDAAVREAGERLLAQSTEGKKIVDKVSGLSGSALDDALTDLEDKP